MLFCKAINSLFFHVVAGSKPPYVLFRQGQCPLGTEIKSSSACSAAAAYLKLADTSASSYSSSSSHGNSYPPFCYYEGGQLKFNSGSHTGSCSSSRQCVCTRKSGVCVSRLFSLRLALEFGILIDFLPVRPPVLCVFPTAYWCYRAVACRISDVLAVTNFLARMAERQHCVSEHHVYCLDMVFARKRL